MAPSFHALQINLFIIRRTTWLFVLSIFIISSISSPIVEGVPVKDFTNSSLEAIMIENLNLTNKRSTNGGKVADVRIRIHSPAKKSPPLQLENYLTTKNETTKSESESKVITGGSQTPFFQERRRRKKKKMMMMMATRRTKRSDHVAVVNLKSKLYSVCSRNFVQIQGSQVNALAGSDSPLGRLEIISEPRPNSVNFELTPFQPISTDHPRRRRRPRHSGDQDSVSFYVKIRSSSSRRYICFNSVGNIISKISGQNPKCRMTEVSHNGAFYYRSSFNNSWFLQFNHRGHRIKNAPKKEQYLSRDDENLTLHDDNNNNTEPISQTALSNCSECSSNSSSSSSSPPPSSSSPSSLTSSSSSSSSATYDDNGSTNDHHHHHRHLQRRNPKYSRCQGFLKIPLSSATAPPSLNFKSIK